MKIALIADTFPPLRTSGAVQLRDLSREFVRQGHSLTVILPAPGLVDSWTLEDQGGVQVLRLKAPQTKDIGYFRRTLGEILMPFSMLRNLRKSPLADHIWEGVVWYAPSIFFGPLVNSLKRVSGCKSYLIIRDIFPEWAVDMGLMGQGLPYLFFRAVADYQYSVADVIGIQSPGNAVYFTDRLGHGAPKLEVLRNWLADVPVGHCSIVLAESSLAGRKVFVYVGNMGVAQGMSSLIDLAESFLDRKDIGFLFVGRGSDAKKLASDAKRRNLENVLFRDEIDPDEIPGLCAQCDFGLVALHPSHKTHNIPGKFLTYMQSGLPVLGCINEGNDLGKLIREKQVGAVATDGKADTLKNLAERLIEQKIVDGGISERCRAVYTEYFSPATAVKKIVNALEKE